MKNHPDTFRSLVVTTRALALGLASLVLSAASSTVSAETLKANVPFPFLAGASGKPLPAGRYEFDISRGEDKVTIHGSEGVIASDLILTTLAAPSQPTADLPRLVFDKVGDVYALSEVWEPGSDGLLVRVTRGKHDHQSVPVGR